MDEQATRDYLEWNVDLTKKQLECLEMKNKVVAIQNPMEALSSKIDTTEELLIKLPRI